MVIRSAGLEDMAAIQLICASELDLEPDAEDLPALLWRSPGRLGLVAESDGGAVIGACFGSMGRVAGRGHVDLLAVARASSGAGTGSRLLAGMENLLRGQGATELCLSGNPPSYIWPGIDVRYTVMTCLASRAGYERYRDAVDMAVDLRTADLSPAALGSVEEPLAAQGIEARRASGAETGPIVEWLRRGPWGKSAWPDEVAASLAREPSGCHVACRDSRYVGFACHGVMRGGWFGPMGTEESERGRGIGAVLLRRCLADMKAAGRQTARIGWVGPVGFYARVAGARVERVYWLYRKALLPQ